MQFISEFSSKVISGLPTSAFAINYVDKIKQVADSVIYSANKLFGNRVTSSERTDHKYIAKVQLSNGEYRYFYDQDEYDAYLKRQEYQENEPDYMKSLPEIDGPMSFEDDAMEINEKISASVFDESGFVSSTSMNCMLCSSAYELRRRGYDVEAAPLTADLLNVISTKSEDKGVAERAKKSGVTVETQAYAEILYKNPVVKTVPKQSVSNAAQYLKDNVEPNSRGNLFYTRKDGSGHSIVYESDSKGNVRLIDTQVSTQDSSRHGIYSNSSDINSKLSDADQINYIRTDNLEFTEEGVSWCARNN